MKEIILEVLSGFQGQLNFQSDVAREWVADELEKELKIYVAQLIEDIVTPAKNQPTPEREG